jgi:hypothetical protein
MRFRERYMLRASAFALMAVCLAAAGCGYSNPKLVRQDIHSVYVPVFDNETFRPGQEKDLTRAVQEEIRRNTELKLAPRSRADSVLRGTITEVDEYVVTKTIGDNIVNKRIGLTVSIEWKDRRTGQPIVSRQEMRVTDRFSPGLGEGKFTGLHEEAAQQIRQSLWADW